MNSALPTRPYNGPITEAARWSRFSHRTGDIFLCAPAKSGMTWMQAICAMLIFGRADLDVQPAKISPWFDAKITPLDQTLAMLEAQTHRRYLKTHTPLDGIPQFDDGTYLAIYRDPRDALFSLMRLAQTNADGATRAKMPPNFRAAFGEWLRADFVPGLAEQPTLAATAHHLMSTWQRRERPNTHLFHYADLSRDLSGSIAKIAAALGIVVSDDAAAAMSQTASFANMQAKSAQFAPASGSTQNARAFFRAGRSGQWRDLLSTEDIAAYRARLAQLLPPDAAAFLEDGFGTG